MFPSQDMRGWSTRSRAYQAIAKAHARFQKRIDEIEVELAGAVKEIALLDECILCYDKRVALCMAHHTRLGQYSRLRVLPEDILIQIANAL
jgi:hypothetical protein